MRRKGDIDLTLTSLIKLAFEAILVVALLFVLYKLFAFFVGVESDGGVEDSFDELIGQLRALDDEQRELEVAIYIPEGYAIIAHNKVAQQAQAHVCGKQAVQACDESCLCLYEVGEGLFDDPRSGRIRCAEFERSFLLASDTSLDLDENGAIGPYQAPDPSMKNIYLELNHGDRYEDSNLPPSPLADYPLEHYAWAPWAACAPSSTPILDDTGAARPWVSATLQRVEIDGFGYYIISGDLA